MSARFAIFALALGAFFWAQQAWAEPNESREYSILFSSNGPTSVTQTSEFNCDRKHVKFILEKERRGATRLVGFTINSKDIDPAVMDDVRDFIAKFARVKTINFSCGGLYEGEHPHSKYGPDFRGQLNISIAGRNVDEPEDAMSECYDRGGVYLEEVIGNITISANEVFREVSPDIGICVFGTKSVTIPRPDAQKENEL